MGEATVPAQQPAAGQAARVSAPHVDAGGAGHRARSSSQGSDPALSLIWRVRDRGTFDAFRHVRPARRGPLTVRFVADPPADRASAQPSGPSQPSGRPLAPLAPRVAYSIGRSVGPAVARNRLRRRLRAVMTTLRRRGIAQGAYLIGAGPGAASCSSAKLTILLTEAVQAATEGGLRD